VEGPSSGTRHMSLFAVIDGDRLEYEIPGVPVHGSRLLQAPSAFSEVNGRNEFTKMKFHPTKLAGVFELHLEPMRDERGLFLRAHGAGNEFEEHGLESALVQCNISFNTQKGNLARYALSGGTVCRDQTCTLHAGSDFATWFSICGRSRLHLKDGSP